PDVPGRVELSSPLLLALSERRELGFPVTQDVRRDLRHLARFGRLVEGLGLRLRHALTLTRGAPLREARSAPGAFLFLLPPPLARPLPHFDPQGAAREVFRLAEQVLDSTLFGEVEALP